MKICHIYGRKTGNFVLSALCDMYFFVIEIYYKIYHIRKMVLFSSHWEQCGGKSKWFDARGTRNSCWGDDWYTTTQVTYAHRMMILHCATNGKWDIYIYIYTSDIVGRFDAFYRSSHSVSYQIYTGFYCVLFSLHTQLFILGFLLLLTRWKWSKYLQDLCMTVTKPKQNTVKRELWLCLIGFVVYWVKSNVHLLTT